MNRSSVNAGATALVAAGLLTLWFPALLTAQIYSWRDANGRLVLSDRPAPSGASYAVSGTARVRATRRAETRAAAPGLDALVVQHAASQGLDADLVRAVIQVESGWNPRARSSKGALGLMQLMPATARDLGVSDPFDPGQNIRGGTAYLRRLLDRFDNDTALALAAYNAGPAAVDRYDGVPPFRETRDYVRRIVSVTPVRLGPGQVIYRVVEVIDGREVPRYTDRKPTGTYRIVGR